MSTNEVAALLDEWNRALQTGNPKEVAALYECNGVLLPTLSSEIRHNREEIEGYFVHFLSRGPAGRIDEANVRIFGQLAVNSGIYTFRFKNGAVVTARFTFVYRWNGGCWKIVEHHSSRMPE